MGSNEYATTNDRNSTPQVQGERDLLRGGGVSVQIVIKSKILEVASNLLCVAGDFSEGEMHS